MKNYVKPNTKVMLSRPQGFCIQIGSGNTTPEQGDANSTQFENEVLTSSRPSLWEE